MKTKVIILTEIISPYRIPVFNEIARFLNEQFLVLFFSESEKRRRWRIYKEKIRFRYEVLPNIRYQKKGRSPCFFNPALIYKLIRYSPDIIIIGGYHHFSSFIALCYAKSFKRQIILWCESNKYEQRSQYVLNEAYKRWFIKNCSGYIVPGKASFEYLLSLGAAAQRIKIAPNAVDNGHFMLAATKYRVAKKEFKQSRGYPDRIILYVGRLIEQKGVFDLLQAFQMLSDESPDLGLLIVGSGEREEQYQNFCRINHLRNVFFEGFVQQEELPFYYAISDVFVLPTYSDPWGLVLNEAMACGLPVISSGAAGAAYDLIADNINGYIFKRGDIQQLSNYLRNILNDEQKRIRMGERSLSIIREYSPLKCAQGFIRAIEYFN
jgi:glycosyltransferase involved in cell wall biosynthesis